MEPLNGQHAPALVMSILRFQREIKRKEFCCRQGKKEVYKQQMFMMTMENKISTEMKIVRQYLLHKKFIKVAKLTKKARKNTSTENTK